MNDNSNPLESTVVENRARTDGLAAVAILVVTVALIVFVVAQLV
jgi:hypothetical protein